MGWSGFEVYFVFQVILCIQGIFWVVPESTQIKTSHAAYSQLFVNIFSRALRINSSIINTIASILRESMYGCLSVETCVPRCERVNTVVCFKMLCKLLLQDAHSFSRASLSENCGLRGTDIFRKIETVVVYYTSNILQYAWKKCLRTAVCVQRGIISPGCFLVRLNEQKNISLLL